jgi:hypothetical protein
MSWKDTDKNEMEGFQILRVHAVDQVIFALNH